MREHLVFTLSATMAAMGELAGHGRRGTTNRPGRSAILGLLAAALGVRRDERDALDALNGLRTAVGVYDEGVHLRDFHTVQTVPSAQVKAAKSRRDALRRAGRDAATSITLRDYRVGVLYGVTVWGGDLERLAEALERPSFHLYLGRKSCPLSAPPAPRLVLAASPIEALDHALLPALDFPPESAPPRPRLLMVASDDDLGGREIETRADVPLDRDLWHFGTRDVHIWRPKET